MGDLGWLTQRPVAHRGLHDAASGIVENSASAVDAAIAAGFAIEVDIQLTRDGEAVVFHDFMLERLTFGKGLVADLPAAALVALPFKGTRDAMMTLDGLLARVAGRVPLLIEIKSAFTDDTRLAVRAAQQVARYDGPVALMSFDPAMVAAVARTAPGVVGGMVAERHYTPTEWPGLSAFARVSLCHLLHWPSSRFQFVAYRVADLPAPATRFVRAIGMPVLTWTVRTPADRDQAARHADQMIFEGFTP